MRREVRARECVRRERMEEGVQMCAVVGTPASDQRRGCMRAPSQHAFCSEWAAAQAVRVARTHMRQESSLASAEHSIMFAPTPRESI